MSILSCEALTKTYVSGGREITVLRDITFELEAGEVLAVTGPSGSGKSTLLGLLAGLDRPARGRVVLDGHDLSALTEDERARLRAEKVGFVFQFFHLIPTLTARENVQVPLELRGEDARARAEDLLARVGPFEFASSGSSAAMANLLPSVAVPPGVTGAAALGRLNQRSDDVLYHRGEFVFANQALPADGADETYRYPHAPATAHPVTGARVKRGARRHNHVRVLGGATGTTVGESLDYEEILNYYAGPLLIADRELTAAADAVARASAAAREIEVESRRDMLTAPVHCGLEVNDVIDLQDSRVGGAARKARVRALMLRYQRGRSPTYEHLIELGEP